MSALQPIDGKYSADIHVGNVKLYFDIFKILLREINFSVFVCLFVLMFYIPANNFSVISG